MLKINIQTSIQCFETDNNSTKTLFLLYSMCYCRGVFNDQVIIHLKNKKRKEEYKECLLVLGCVGAEFSVLSQTHLYHS